MDFSYPVAERAVKRWKSERLEEIEPQHFLFHYQGSTCSNGGVPFIADFHVIVDKSPTLRIQSAWIEMPEEEEENWREMCSFQSRGEKFLREITKEAAFAGKTVEEVLNNPGEINYAGCLCFPAMVNQKWQMVLSTVHYACAVSGA
ncbi:MAG: hypothetical protein K9L68_02390 [Spirochaetales bacterium]|nr:hypothetical protein [Spirochaetales bacterium]MCF7937425.1 hypothetical protein [Spirochaetales bacterium]